MAWEDTQPRAVMRRAREAERRERDAAMDPNSGDIKLSAGERLSREWRRPVIVEPPPEALMNRQERLLAEIRDAIKGEAKPELKQRSK